MSIGPVTIYLEMADRDHMLWAHPSIIGNGGVAVLQITKCDNPIIGCERSWIKACMVPADSSLTSYLQTKILLRQCHNRRL